MTGAELILFIVLVIPSAIVFGWWVGGKLARRRGVLTPDRTPRNPPAPTRLVPIGGCTECGERIGTRHLKDCSRARVPGPVHMLVVEADCRHLTVGDMGMG